MSEAASNFDVRVAGGIQAIPRDEWNAILAPDDSPFVEWDWLYAMEESGAAQPGAGWTPCHIVVRGGPNKQLVAALPLYLKTHSMGEFVFDHGWADAAERAGIRYYPKLLAGVPFTPHTGRRFLTRPGANRAALIANISRAIEAIRDDNDLSGVHVNFCESDESAALGQHGYIERLGYQYHWRNAGYSAFDDFLGHLKHKRRTAIRHERAAMADAGIEIRGIAGEDIPDRLFPEMYRIYLSTIEKLYWGRQYLPAKFFEILRDRFKRNLVLIGAYAGRELIAGAICVEKAGVLYGRYWGCFREVRFLHFNVCYYAGIEHCIERGLDRFEPGAGGEYKWLRGFDPALTRSNHLIAEPRLRRAVASAVARERAEVERFIAAGPQISQLKHLPPSDAEAR